MQSGYYLSLWYARQRVTKSGLVLFIPETGSDYIELPPVVIVSIVDFKLFDSSSFYSDFCILETTQHELLTDKMKLCYFELPKLPREIDAYNELLLWLNLFSAETVEEVQKIKATGVPVMKEAINAYDALTATREFRELERLRDRASHNEAAALRHAREEAKAQERAKWQTVVAEKDAALVGKDAAAYKTSGTHCGVAGAVGQWVR